MPFAYMWHDVKLPKTPDVLSIIKTSLGASVKDNGDGMAIPITVKGILVPS